MNQSKIFMNNHQKPTQQRNLLFSTGSNVKLYLHKKSQN